MDRRDAHEPGLPVPPEPRLLVEDRAAECAVERQAPGVSCAGADPAAPHLTGAVGTSQTFIARARDAGLPTVALSGDPWLDAGRIRWLADAPTRTPEAVMHDRAAMCALRDREGAAHDTATRRPLPAKAAHRLLRLLRRTPVPLRDPRRSGCPPVDRSGDHPVPQHPRVSVVVPHRDAPHHLRRVLEGLRGTRWDDLEIVVVDNGSVSPESIDLLQSPALRAERMPGAFNFARLCNRGAHVASGQVLVFLNDDIELGDPGWLAGMVAALRDPGTAIVGAVLTFPDGRIQHAGMAVVDGVPVHPFAHAPMTAADLWLRRPERSAVTAACMAVRAGAFWGIGGFDPLLARDYNDVDLCFRAWDAGYAVRVVPDVRLVHHEGASRGRDVHTDTVADWLVFRTRWAGRLSQADPLGPPRPPDGRGNIPTGLDGGNG